MTTYTYYEAEAETNYLRERCREARGAADWYRGERCWNCDPAEKRKAPVQRRTRGKRTLAEGFSRFFGRIGASATAAK